MLKTLYRVIVTFQDKTTTKIYCNAYNEETAHLKVLKELSTIEQNNVDTIDYEVV
jgi:hypothetical protein